MSNGLGRIKLHDPKNRVYAFPRLAVDTWTSVRHRLDAPHVDQFYLSGCVGFSGANILNTRAARKSRRRVNGLRRLNVSYNYMNNNDGIEFYTRSTQFDPFDWTYPPDDKGSSALGLMQYWLKFGIIRSYSWTFTFRDFLAALQRQPVLVGTDWYDDMMTTDAHGVIHSMAAGPGGGHEYLANAINWPKRLIGFEQSWGENPPGFKPRFYMPFGLAEELIIYHGGDVAVPEFL